MGKFAVSNPTKATWTLAIAMLAGLAMVLFTLGTWWGIGLRPDSALYLGLWEESRHQQAPLYGWLIDLGAAGGIDRKSTAWLLNGVLLLFNLYLFLRLLAEAGATFPAQLTATILVIFLPQFIYVHQTVLSEPLFLSCLLVSYLFTARYLETRDRKSLYLGAVFASAMVLTRFAGIPIVGAGALALLLYGRGGFKQRLSDSLLFGFIAVGIFTIWLLSDRLSGGSGVGREAAFLGNPSVETFRHMLGAFTAYFLPSFVPSILSAVILLAVAAGLIWLGWVALRPKAAGQGRPVPAVARLSILFFVAYLSFLVLTLFIEHALTIQGRYLLPLYVSGLLLAFSILGQGSSMFKSKWARRIAVAAVCGLIFVNAGRGVATTYSFMLEGNFYASPNWYGSPTLARLATMDSDLRVYSNAPDAILLLSERKAEFWPQLFDRRTGMELPDRPLEAQVASLGRELRNGQAIVVSFEPVTWRFYLMKEERLVEQLGLALLYGEADGRIYGMGTTQLPQGSASPR